MKDIPDEHPPAPAFRASGSELDVRSGDDAPGFYAEAGYSPVVRTGGTPLDRALVLLGEVVSSLELIDKAHEVADYGGPPEARALGAGSGSGLWESSHGGLEYRVFLASDGRLSRVRPASAADVVAELVGPALKGAPFEDVAPALVSLNMCVSCSTA
jgi:Ni,Fe-hydrogenase III large subunit